MAHIGLQAVAAQALANEEVIHDLLEEAKDRWEERIDGCLWAPIDSTSLIDREVLEPEFPVKDYGFSLMQVTGRMRPRLHSESTVVLVTVGVAERWMQVTDTLRLVPTGWVEVVPADTYYALNAPSVPDSVECEPFYAVVVSHPPLQKGDVSLL